jgi:hypothetical protein
MKKRHKLFLFILIMSVLAVIEAYAQPQQPLLYGYKISLTSESTPASTNCLKAKGELDENNQALENAIYKGQTCLAGKIAINNQKLLENNSVCKIEPIRNYISEDPQKICSNVGLHMKLSMDKITQLIKEAKECEVGEILKSDQDYLKQYPACQLKISTKP